MDHENCHCAKIAIDIPGQMSRTNSGYSGVMFDIRLSSDAPAGPDDGVSAVYGRLQIGEFQETFVASLSHWCQSQYLQQWREAAQRLIDGEAKSAFVTSFVPPSHALHFVWWPCYLSDETVYVQNQLRFYEQLPSPFDVDSLYDYIEDRKTVSADDGALISEWQMPLEWLRDFLRRSHSLA
jgi:hypothetical protein